MSEPTARGPVGPPRGIVRLPHEAPFVHRRLAPSAALAPVIAHFWSVQWKLDSPETVETLPHPTVHVVFDRHASGERAEVVGVASRRFARSLHGEGWAFGIKFRPATFRTIFGRPLHELTDRTVALADALADGLPLAKAIAREGTFEARAVAAEVALLPRLPALTPEQLVLRDLVERTASDSSIVTVDDLVQASGYDRRSLQRHFRELVGVGPKWVIRRYRLHEAAERLRREPELKLTRLAAELGYADQAHFSRDFKESIGESPREFVQRITRERSRV